MLARRAMMVMAIGLALVPAAASAQQVGVSVRVVAPQPQPSVTIEAPTARGESSGVSGSIPAGWAWSVEEGAGATGRQVAERRGSESMRTELAAARALGGPGAGSVTWTFVPL